jgi:hypothetical protein
MLEITKEIRYKSPFGTYPRILGEEFIMIKGKKQNGSIRYYTARNIYAIRVGSFIVEYVFDWMRILCPYLSYDEAKKNGFWIIFRKYNKEYQNSHVKGTAIEEKSAQKAALRLFNMIKYFLKNYQTLRTVKK